jgi:hypothetical protein
VNTKKNRQEPFLRNFKINFKEQLAVNPILFLNSTLLFLTQGVLARQNANAGLTEREGGGGNRNRQQNRNNESTGPPPEDFRTMDVQLSEDDILTQNEAVYLRKAIIQGTYTDDEHYLDVQFRLLREDLCRPLRAGIYEFRAAQNNNNHHNRGRNSLLVYRDVRFAGIELHTQDGKILAYLRLSPVNINFNIKIYWDCTYLKNLGPSPSTMLIVNAFFLEESLLIPV